MLLVLLFGSLSFILTLFIVKLCIANDKLQQDYYSLLEKYNMINDENILHFMSKSIDKMCKRC